MGFGRQLRARSESSGLEHLNYHGCKALILKKEALAATKMLEEEVARINDVFIAEESRCQDRFSELERHRIKTGTYPIGALPALTQSVVTLMNYGRWNYVAVMRLFRLAETCHCYIRGTAHHVLNDAYFYRSLGPARILCRLPRRTVDTRNLSDPAVLDLAPDEDDQHLPASPGESETAGDAINQTEELGPLSALDDDCPICLSDRMLDPCMCSCGHVFCYECITQTERQCPICRKHHFQTFAMLGSGDIISAERQRQDETWLHAAWGYGRDTLWYLLLTVVLMPFLLFVFGVGFVWSVGRSAICVVLGVKHEFPAPFRYARFPFLAPQYVNTAPPPWTTPALWQA
ncbi:uncharacterized protein MONBRDRAFT_11600 [Monosiga brevicollis MX1]|uniref:RING-type domain-containing protein n=1 Tax=Monosiga brevicollis TaxID=81824 RepID=A9V9R2_MONBE|nr:uncharacterized protein MONBRDRAFT_11600 [Monosiga brevicollis MX1]EDQ85768.1 predicted protein [Monosiga brevicollis MX1]|eukprot:XP_001749483.1 hypothetical protein [Monosiga brevicollis MX1]